MPLRSNPRRAAICAVAAASAAVLVAIDHHAHGWWTFTRTFDDAGSAVCMAEHRDYRVVGRDARAPLIDFPAMGVGPVTVSAYCALFAREYAARSSVALEEGAVRVRRAAPFGRWLANAVQPPGSRFLSGHRCRFRTSDAGSTPGRSVSVRILVAETREFAEHTQWPRLQIVPIAGVVVGDRTGYGVFKFFRED